jgi:hypothetical protein
MTVIELQDLIARGAAQPGVSDALELMRLSEDLERQARDQLELYGISTTAVTCSSGVVGSTEPTATNHADVG